MWWQAGEPRQKLQGDAGSHRDMNARQSGLLVAMERKNRLMKEASEEEVTSKFFKEVLIPEEKLTEV